MSGFSMAASHAAGKGEVDAVFGVLRLANEALARHGKEKVINASVGSIFDDEEKFAALPAVDDYLRKMPAEELMNYAPIAGLPGFLEAAVEQAFQGKKPKNTFIRAVATPGGTGAVRNVFYNYSEQGQKILVPDWFWGPYRTIIHEHLRVMENYPMFDENNNFHISAVKNKSLELLQSQDSLVVVFNTPGHNPTGYSMKHEEWTELLDFYKNCAENRKKKITILVDLAYIDFVGSAETTRDFMILFEGLPENILITMAYSMSKSFLLYGMRSGAVIGVSSSEEVAEEFFRINSFSNRGVWSNGTRGAQRLLAEVGKNPELKARCDEERRVYTEMLLKRAALFLKEAKEVGLKTLPYHGGFFITVPAQDPQAATEKLAQDNIFAVPLKKGIRFAICSIALSKIPGLAAKTKEALSSKY
ncbi:MAG: aminotransferase class I/II-fold pyridoxal phosphate-dependent enzyme [Peptococcaceae bacterium]|nr:aminotransferase class I/II-fold pyridoxal phosphate-dependent enzyme [Peptococcaceae bacterium]MDH7524603.1 aminotransferase class I/II-fold pyridoxal phosphate-dependent enzyme [Peptococcaceae bacterium]